VAACLLLLMLIAGVVVSSIGFARASEQAGIARVRTAEFDMLANVVHLRVAQQREALLHPPWPENAAPMRQWLEQDTKRLRDLLPTLRATIAALETRALPMSEAEAEASRRAHPDSPQLEWMQAKLAALRQQRAVALGEQLEVPPLPAELAASDAKALSTWAWERVAPDAEGPVGEELLALAAAQHAVERIERLGDMSTSLHAAFDILAHAWLAAGRADDAVAAIDRAHDTAPGSPRSARAPSAAAGRRDAPGTSGSRRRPCALLPRKRVPSGVRA
jgi:hypothetical protein